MKLLSILVSIKREVWGLFILQIYTYLGFMLHRSLSKELLTHRSPPPCSLEHWAVGGGAKHNQLRLLVAC